MFGLEKFKSKIELSSVIILLVAVISELMIILYFNFFHVKEGIDQDYASLLYHGMEMARNHRILLDNWSYSSTAELDSPMMLAALFMLVIHNPFYSFAMANVLNIALFMVVLYILMDNAGASIKSKLIAYALVFTAYDFGVLHYTNMLFIRGGQFFVKALLPLFFIAVMTMPKEKRDSWKVRVLGVLLYLIAFVSVFSSGISVFVTCFLPVIICFFMYYGFSVKDNEQKHYLIHIGLSIVITFAGLVCEKIFGLHNKAETFNIRNGVTIAEAFGETLSDIFSCLRFFPQKAVSAMSFEGVGAALRWCIIAVFCVGFASIYRALGIHLYGKNKSDNSSKDFTKAALVSVFAITFLIQLMTKSRSRYHIPGIVTIMIVAAMNLDEYSEKLKATSKNILYLILGVIFIGNAFFSVKYDAKYWLAGEKSEYVADYEANRQIKDALDEHGIEIAFTNENNQLRAGLQFVDPDRVYYIYDSNGSISGSWDQYMTYKYMDKSVLPARNAFISPNMDIVPDYVKENYTDIGPIGPYQVLISDVNPLDPQSVIDPVQKTVDLPSNPGYEKMGHIDQFGYLYTTEEGNVLQSPWIPAPCKFTYELNYEWDGEGTVSCDIYKDDNFYSSSALEQGDNSLKLTFEEAGNYMFVIFKQGTGELSVREMFFEGIK